MSEATMEEVMVLPTSDTPVKIIDHGKEEGPRVEEGVEPASAPEGEGEPSKKGEATTTTAEPAMAPPAPPVSSIGGAEVAVAAAAGEAEEDDTARAEGGGEERVVGDDDADSGDEDETRQSRRSTSTSLTESTLRIDRWGFIVQPQQHLGGEDDFRKTPKHKLLAEKELSRSKKWLKMLRNWDRYESVKQAKIKRRIRKGIPDALRRQAWGTLVGLHDEMKLHPTLYADLCARTDIPDREIHDTIERDIDRTFPRHVMFSADNSEGQSRLRRVLHAYSRHDVEVGYCQGMGFITAMLLTYFPEDEAFYMIDIIMNKRPAPIRRLYLPMMPRAQEMMFVADCVFRKLIPKLHRHFQAQCIHRSMYMTQWVVCIFTNSFPFDMVTRVWDGFLAEGWKVVYRVMLGILKYFEKDLFKKDFEKLMEFFRVLPTHISQEASNKILEIAFKYKLKRKQLDEYEKAFLKDGGAGSGLDI